MDPGRGLLLEMRPSRTTILYRTVGTSRICAQTAVYLLSDLPTICSIQALGLRVNDFLPIKCSIIEVLGQPFAAVATTQQIRPSLSIRPRLILVDEIGRLSSANIKSIGTISSGLIPFDR
ncbi:MAG TPA: hypothetical protein VE862_00060, partial [Candidatus Acidoferrum sp.]|nr:hypothetical protein [Candidatus Acidoferrum sp.]